MNQLISYAALDSIAESHDTLVLEMEKKMNKRVRFRKKYLY